MNKYLFEFVNLREHCSWVHMEQPDEATVKAKDLVRMGVAKVALLTPQDDLTSNVVRTSLVIGGGISGLSASLTLANQGYQVELIEKEDHLGGLLGNVNRVFPTNEPVSDLLVPLIKAVSNHKNIRCHLETELVEVQGFIGNFQATIESSGEREELNAGTIIVATCARRLLATSWGRSEASNSST